MICSFSCPPIIYQIFILDKQSSYMHTCKTYPNFYQDLSTENYKQEVQNLRRQLELVSEERDELRVSIYCNRFIVT